METFSNAKILLQIDLGPADRNSYAIKVEGSLKVLGTHTDIVQFTVSALCDRQCKAIDTHTGQTVSISKQLTVVQLFEKSFKNLANKVNYLIYKCNIGTLGYSECQFQKVFGGNVSPMLPRR